MEYLENAKWILEIGSRMAQMGDSIARDEAGLIERGQIMKAPVCYAFIIVNS